MQMRDIVRLITDSPVRYARRASRSAPVVYARGVMHAAVDSDELREAVLAASETADETFVCDLQEPTGGAYLGLNQAESVELLGSLLGAHFAGGVRVVNGDDGPPVFVAKHRYRQAAADWDTLAERLRYRAAPHDSSATGVANATSRTSGAVGKNAIVPKLALEILRGMGKGATVLDFGAGKDAAHAQMVAAKGYPVAAWEYGANAQDGVHDPNALDRRYTLVYASNVLNVQDSPDELRRTIQEAAESTEGLFLANLPSEPRKGAFEGKTGEQAADLVLQILQATFPGGAEIVQGGTSSPVFVAAATPDAMAAAAPLRNARRYEKVWRTIGGGAPAMIDTATGSIVAACEGLEGQDLDDIGAGEDPDNRAQRDARQEAFEQSGGLSRRVIEARDTWEEAKRQMEQAGQTGFVALVRDGDQYHTFGPDARIMLDVTNTGDGETAEFDREDLDHHLAALVNAGHRAAVIDRDEHGQPEYGEEAEDSTRAERIVQDEAEFSEKTPVDPVEAAEQAPGAVGDLLRSLVKLRDVRKTGQVTTDQLDSNYAQRVYDSIQGEETDGYGDVYDLSDELGPGAIGYHSPAGVLAMIPPRTKTDDWEIRYATDTTGAAPTPEHVVSAEVDEGRGPPQIPPAADPSEPVDSLPDEPAEEPGSGDRQPTEVTDEAGEQQSGTRRRELSDQEQGERAWERNWARVMADPEGASRQDILRAAGFARALQGHYNRQLDRGEITPEQRDTLHDGVQTEHDNLRRILREREAAGDPGPDHQTEAEMIAQQAAHGNEGRGESIWAVGGRLGLNRQEIRDLMPEIDEALTVERELAGMGGRGTPQPQQQQPPSEARQRAIEKRQANVSPSGSGEPQAADLPDWVRDQVQDRLDAIGRIHDALAEGRDLDRRFGGEGRYESEVWAKEQKNLVWANDWLNDTFRPAAASEGFDPDAVLREMGHAGQPQLSADGKEYHEHQTDKQWINDTLEAAGIADRPGWDAVLPTHVESLRNAGVDVPTRIVEKYAPGLLDTSFDFGDNVSPSGSGEPQAADDFPDDWDYDDLPDAAEPPPEMDVDPPPEYTRRPAFRQAVDKALPDASQSERAAFASMAVDYHKNLAEGVEEYNAAYRDLLGAFIKKTRVIDRRETLPDGRPNPNYGRTKSLDGQQKRAAFIRHLQRAEDTDKIPHFDEMVEYAQRYTPQLLAPGKGTFAAESPEYLLFQNLQKGLQPEPKLHDDEVIGGVLQYLSGGPARNRRRATWAKRYARWCWSRPGRQQIRYTRYARLKSSPGQMDLFGDWEEEKHPRDEKGQFAAKPGEPDDSRDDQSSEPDHAFHFGGQAAADRQMPDWASRRRNSNPVDPALYRKLKIDQYEIERPDGPPFQLWRAANLKPVAITGKTGRKVESLESSIDPSEYPEPDHGDAPLVVACGMGVDSWAMLVDMHNKGVRPDVIHWADTGSERPHTYRSFNVLQDWCKRVGFPPIAVVRRASPTAGHRSLFEQNWNTEQVPSAAYSVNHSCSIEWKLKPQRKFDSQLPWLMDWAESGGITTAIGFDADEVQGGTRRGLNKITEAVGFDAEEVGTRRSGTKAQGPRYETETKEKGESDEMYQAWFPLAEEGLDRQDCIDLIRDAGLPVPGKSACFHCPFAQGCELDTMRGTKEMEASLALEERFAAAQERRKTEWKVGHHIDKWVVSGSKKKYPTEAKAKAAAKGKPVEQVKHLQPIHKNKYPSREAALEAAGGDESLVVEPSKIKVTGLGAGRKRWADLLQLPVVTDVKPGLYPDELPEPEFA